MKKKVKLTIIVIILLIALLILVGYLRIPRVNKDFKKLDLTGYDRLMIVAHPDDEMLWGGKELIENNYLVVCITCGKDKGRVIEFDNVMKATNDKYIMLGYPDKTKGKRDNWDTVREDLVKDLKDIMELKDWEIVVTHNPYGEYGHIHHVMTSQIITRNISNTDKLVYFGKYYSKKRIGDKLNKLEKMDKKVLDQKVEVLKLYKSQSFIMHSFDHMMEYENWLTYNEWQEGEK